MRDVRTAIGLDKVRMIKVVSLRVTLDMLTH